MIDKYLQHVVTKINDRVLQLQETLADDNVKDFAEYKKNVRRSERATYCTAILK